MPGRRAARRALTAAPEQPEGLTAAAAVWTEPAHLAPEQPRLGLVAAATRVDVAVAAKSRRKILQADWQEEAWHHYNRSGELQAAAGWMANSLSRIRLYAAEVGPDGRPGDPTDNAMAQAIAAKLFGGPAAAAQVLGALGVHLTVPGDCWVVCESPAGSADDDWFVVSTAELVRKGERLGIDRGGDEGWRALADGAVLIRIWNPHPQKREEATSATRASLPVLRELEKLDARQLADLESRLAGAGILFVPDNLTFKAASPQAQAGNPQANALLLALTEAMVTAVEDRDDPAALVPLVVQAPADAISAIQHITFGSEIADKMQESREECIRRLALGLDLPPEELLGKGGANHWSSWQIEEGGVKVHVEPKAVTICAALTETYFRPALKAAGVENPDRYVLWYDVSELVLRPNRAADAKELAEAGRLSDAVLLREAGFDPKADAPSVAERAARVLAAAAAASPAEAATLLPALIHLWRGQPITTMPAITLCGSGHADGTTEQPPAEAPADSGTPSTPSGGDDPSPAQGGTNHTPAAGSGDGEAGMSGDGLTLAREVAVEGLVSRGLEFAGKRLLTRARRGQYPDVDLRLMYRQDGVAVAAEDVPRLLDGAWLYLPEVAAQVGLDPVRLQDHLADHVSALLTSGTAHERRFSSTIVKLSAA